ncbi:MAG TPA: HAD-IA family hydrolase [Gaiellaceae bacterium]|nr:HAD-IA family hydrolase [Gaiellaceae bacterium]
MRFPVCLFDFDGTVADSGAIILASFRHAARTVLGEDVPDVRLRAMMGGASLQEQMAAIAPERVEELVRCYREHNEPLHAELQCCPGMLDVLERLHGEGRRLAIVTAKRHATVELALARLPLRDYFETIVAAEDTARHKPDPEPILLALERLGAAAADAVYVGDSPFDVGAARAAGVHAIGVTWGGMHAMEDADEIVSTPEELLAAL